MLPLAEPKTRVRRDVQAFRPSADNIHCPPPSTCRAEPVLRPHDCAAPYQRSCRGVKKKAANATAVLDEPNGGIRQALRGILAETRRYTTDVAV